MPNVQPKRCTWVNVDHVLMREYHDREWGVPAHDDPRHFEFLILEAAQAGLSWSIVLNKRKGYSRAFSDFNPEKVARYSAARIDKLTTDPGIIRNRLKIAAAVKNAKAAGEPIPCRKVVNISSLAGTGGNAGQANYSAAKAGVTGLTKALAKEWGRYNVTVNAVAFGMIKTRLTEAPAGAGATIDVAGRAIKVGVNPDVLTALEQSIPLGRGGSPAEAAGAVYLLCTPESDYVSAQTLICGGGLNF